MPRVLGKARLQNIDAQTESLFGQGAPLGAEDGDWRVTEGKRKPKVLSGALRPMTARGRQSLVDTRTECGDGGIA